MSAPEIAAIVDYLVSHHVHHVPLEAEKLEKLAVRKKAAVRTIMQQHDQLWVGFNFSVVFAKFLEQVPEWGLTSPEVAVFFKNPANENHPYLLSLRHQTTGNCGAHASVQLLHYLMDIRSDGSANVGSVDITAHMQLSELFGEELLKYLTGKKKHKMPLFYFAALGTLDVQRLLCLTFNRPYADEQLIAGNLHTAALIMEQLQFQPGMVTKFTVSSSFVESSLVSFTGLPVFGGGESAHAMLIIGARRAGDNYFFLLQNWHARKQFLEVSAEYLAHCCAEVYFVRPTQVITLAHATPLTDYPATECAIVESDAEEEDDDYYDEE